MTSCSRGKSGPACTGICGNGARATPGEKLAVQAWAAFMVSVAPGAAPAQSPDQALKIDPGAGVATSVTGRRTGRLALQVAPQSIAAGTVLTLPLPVPALDTVSAKFFSVKLAVQRRVADSVTVADGLDPMQSPLQPEKIEPIAGEAVSVTLVPGRKSAEQATQSMPAGLEVMLPRPSPALATVSAKTCRTKRAVQLRAADIVTVAVGSAPLQSPLQPANSEPAAGAAVSVALLAAANMAVQLDPQSIPDGLEVTRPLPLPALATVSAKRCAVKVATQLRAAVIVTRVPGPPPGQSPDQPSKVEPASGTAVSVTLAPRAKLAEQLAPQSIPDGLEAMRPLPLPLAATLNTAVVAGGVG